MPASLPTVRSKNVPQERIPAGGIAGIVSVEINAIFKKNTDGTDDVVVEAPDGVVCRAQMVPVPDYPGWSYLYIQGDGSTTGKVQASTVRSRGSVRNDVNGRVDGFVFQVGSVEGDVHVDDDSGVYQFGDVDGDTSGSAFAQAVTVRIPPGRNIPYCNMIGGVASSWVTP